MSDHREPDTTRHEWFLTTHWSVVMAAGHGDSSRARLALEQLCRTYWYPLYAFVRRLGHRPHDAEDLVQSFFTLCVEKHYLGAADAAKGRFRSFLLLALKRFLANQHDRARAQKRGGQTPPLSLDALTAEQRYALEPAEQLTADRLFERRWALTLLDTVLARLRDEYATSGRLEVFETLNDSLGGAARDTPYAELAKQLGTTVGAVKVSVHRLRRRYRELLEAEIAHTVGSPDEVAEERRYLLTVLSG